MELSKKQSEFVESVRKMTPIGYSLAVSDKSNEFSFYPCELCGSKLGGSRHEISAYNPTTMDTVVMSACVDCACYVANGDIPNFPISAN